MRHDVKVVSMAVYVYHRGVELLHNYRVRV